MFEGHSLSEQTMLLAVPAINIALYVNPVLSYLINGALIVMTIDNCGTTHGNNRTHCFYFYFSVSEDKKAMFIFTRPELYLFVIF